MILQLPNVEVFRNLRHVHVVAVFFVSVESYMSLCSVFLQRRGHHCGEPVTAELFETGR